MIQYLQYPVVEFQHDSKLSSTCPYPALKNTKSTFESERLNYWT